jgi:hypothetical protein
VTVAPAEFAPAPAEIWEAFLALAERLAANVYYGPGRGIWDVDHERFLLTYAPGRRSKPSDLIAWANFAGTLYPSLHCTSLCNVVLAWLLKRNGDFAHANSSVDDFLALLLAGPEPRAVPGVGTVRGYGDACFEIPSNGSTKARVRALIRGQAYTDAVELYERRSSLPTFVVFGQSTKQADGSWWEWHHTGIFAFRDGRMFRLAADGWHHQQRGYSATPVHWTEITPANIGTLDLCRYRVFGVKTLDGTFGDPTRPIAEVAFE